MSTKYDILSIISNYSANANNQINYGIDEITIPAILNDSNTLAWYDASISYITKDSNNRVSQWNDKSGNDNHLIQAIQSKQPIWSSDGILFDGIDDVMQKTFTLNQPVSFYTILRQRSWSTADFLFSGAGAAVVLTQRTARPGLMVYGGNFSSLDNNAPVYQWVVIRIIFNGASSRFTIDNNTTITGNFGSSNPGGISLGARHDEDLPANVEFKEFIARDIADSESDELIIFNYLYSKVINETPYGVDLSFKITNDLIFPTFANILINSGSYVYLSFGDGDVKRISDAEVDPTWINKTYATGNTTYDIKIFGDLDAITKFQSPATGWNIDITEFEKTENIEYIGITGNRPNQLSGTITNLITLKEWWLSAPVEANATGIIGNINSLSDLEVLECQGYTANYPLANLTGTFSNIPKLKQQCAVHKIMGDISMLTGLEYWSWGYAQGTPTDPQIQSGEGTPRIWGTISNMSSLWYFACNGGAATLTGNTDNLESMEVFQYVPPLLIKPSDLQSMPKLSYFAPGDTWQFTATEVNQYLADIWANREVVRQWAKNTIGETYGTGWRDIDLSRNAMSASPTGQGITDKNNLNTTISPAIPGNGVTWDIITN